MKAVITVQKEDGKKLQVAAHVNKVKIIQDGSADLGNGQYMVTIDTLDPANLFAMGKSFAVVKGNELDGLFAAEKAKADAKAKAAAGK